MDLPVTIESGTEAHFGTACAREARPRPTIGPAPRRARSGGLLRFLAKMTLFTGFLLFAFGAGSFLHFTALVAATRAPADVGADGIVVLTGGRDRVHGAIDLLEEGRAKRLLISGVHPLTRAEDIQRATESNPTLFRCCVDLGFKAETTVGNARETADWVRRQGFRSLIVVTSAYHMPRSLAELGQAMPEVTLIPFPVKRSDLNLDTWYVHPRTLKLLTAEYLKYMLARLRLGMETIERPAVSKASASPAG